MVINYLSNTFNNILKVLSFRLEFISLEKKEVVFPGLKKISIYNLELDIDKIISISNNTNKKVIIAINKMIHTPVKTPLKSNIQNNNIQNQNKPPTNVESKENVFSYKVFQLNDNNENRNKQYDCEKHAVLLEISCV